MILNIYKPKGFTSFDAVARVKKQLNTKKVGHAGTLDPLAEGVLVVLTGADTKKQDSIMKQPKEYEAEITFSITTPSLDLEFIPTFVKSIPLEEVRSKLPEMLKKYTGDFDQRVPDFSAKKVEGKRLYELARQGTTVAPTDEQKLYKQVNISEIKVYSYQEKEIETNAGKIILPSVVIKVACSHGTYLRSLARDLGNDLGCGGTLTKLVRTKVGNFSIENSIQLENVKQELKF